MYKTNKPKTIDLMVKAETLIYNSLKKISVIYLHSQIFFGSKSWED